MIDTIKIVLGCIFVLFGILLSFNGSRFFSFFFTSIGVLFFISLLPSDNKDKKNVKNN
jgi:hypothetical protein